MCAAVALCIVLGSVLLVAGCIGEKGAMKNSTLPQNGNNSSELVEQINFPSPYHDPIGGFDQTSGVLIPNTVFEMNYTFYSQDWGPGEINYTISAWYMNSSYDINRTYWCCPFLLKNAEVKIEPSSFIIEQNRSYHSKVSLVTASLPKEFFTGTPDNGGTSYYSTRLNISVLIGNNSSQFVNDQVTFLSSYRGARSFGDKLSPSNRSLQIKRGERKEFSFTFEPDYDIDIGQIACVSTPTQLNVTIYPSSFIEKHFTEFPLTVSILADQNLTPGIYPFDLKMKRITSPVGSKALDRKTSVLSQSTQTQSSFAINVTVVE